jgi:peptidoglycan/xylan/chitin deacetylase (PgdA/CDA1 family)
MAGKECGNIMKYQKAITFSYDDGIESDRKLVEILNRYGMKCTFNLNTGIQSRESCFEIEGKEICRMDQETIGDLYAGHEIAVHGLTHRAPVDMTEEEMDQEFLTDIDNITRIYGQKPVGMAYAYGAYDQAAVDYLQRHGIKYGRTVEATHGFAVPENPILLKATCHHDDEQLFELAQQFLESEPAPGEQQLFYIWGHSYEYYVKDNWDRLEKLCRMFADRRDIFRGTNRECLEMFGAI